MGFPIFHGIKLAANASIQNLVVESLVASGDNDLGGIRNQDIIGNIWFNGDDKVFEYGTGGNGFQSFTTSAQLTQAITDYDAKLASQVAGSEGSALIGTSATNTTNGNFDIAAGTVLASLTSVAQAIDTDMQALADYQALLLSSAANEGASKVGVAPIADPANTATTNVSGIATGTTVQGALSSIISDVDDALNQEITRVNTDFLNKTTTTAQTVASSVTFSSTEQDADGFACKFLGNTKFAGSLTLEGDLIHNGDNVTTQGETVLFEDTIISLASNVDDATDDENLLAQTVGWSIKRGTFGDDTEHKTDTMLWIEGSKSVRALTTWTKYTWDDTGLKANATTSTVYVGNDLSADTAASVGQKIVVRAELENELEGVDIRLQKVEEQVNGNIGDLDDLATNCKDTIVCAVNELHQDAVDDRTNLAAQTADASGSSLVGYDGATGANSKFSLPASAVDVALDSIVAATDSDRKEFDDYTTNLETTGDATNGGGSIVGVDGVSGTTGGGTVMAVSAGKLDTVLAGLQSEIVSNATGVEVAETNIDSLVSNINDNNSTYEGASATQHVFAHGLGTSFLNVTTWVKEDGVWSNTIVAVSVDDTNITVDLTESKEVRILAQKFTDVSKLYNQ